MFENYTYKKKKSKFCVGEVVRSGRRRVQWKEAERSCLNTGDGCNRILSLNDGQRGERTP